MFHTFLINPIYNAFIYLIGVMPHGDVGLAIIAATLLIRIIFFPLFASSIRTQMGMQAIQGELDEINKKYKDKAEERGRKTMELFREHKVRPLSAFFALLVQIPVFIALYYAFFHVGLPVVATNLLYSFVHAPAVIGTNFFGIMNLLAAHNIVLALIVGLLQYAVVRLSLVRTAKPKNASSNPKDQAQALQQQLMLYFLPALIAFASYSLPAAAGLYFAAGSVISLAQEWLIQRQMRAKAS
ncbi:MAG TPA: YidC/Oxa1 family membrane protein insertase [Candidatus Paceibacterota bacterium]|nr:YidC/Oxa1 family membrane protein insertase [Candidatus Paceibacterota bacterium]